MTPSNSALRAELGTTLKQLQDSLHRLADHIRHEARDAWLWQAPTATTTRGLPQPPPELSRDSTLRGIAAGLQSIKYEDDAQDAHESRIYPGIVALPLSGVLLADEVNRHKTALVRVLKDMEGRTEIGTVDPRTGEQGARPLREIALEAFYFRRLHYWQATRRVEVLRETPDSMGTLDYVGFMWATSREVRRTSREALLEQARAPDARLMDENDLEILAALPPKEPLAIVRPGHTTPKANIRWQPRDGSAATTKVRIAVLPLVMLGHQLPTRLRRLPPTRTPKHMRLPRVDVDIESTPLLRTYPVYRYLKPLRAAKRRNNTRSPSAS